MFNRKYKEVCGFYGQVEFSPSREYCVAFADGYFNQNQFQQGNVALLKNDEILFKVRIDRPHDCCVTDHGVLICSDWKNANELTGEFMIFDSNGTKIFSRHTTANLGNSAISEDSKIAIFNTLASDTEDSGKMFIVDVQKREIVESFSNPYTVFFKAKIDTGNQRILIIDKREFGYEINYKGEQTNKHEYEEEVMSKGSTYDKLFIYDGRPEELNFNDASYVQLLIQALDEKDVQISYGLANINRRIGEYYEANKDLLKAIEYYQKAIEVNPKIGVKKRLEKIKKMI